MHQIASHRIFISKQFRGVHAPRCRQEPARITTPPNTHIAGAQIEIPPLLSMKKNYIRGI